jgi:hypothetical protein
MPRGIFHVVRVDGLVQLELFPALLEFFRVIKRQAALPELRRGLRQQFDYLVERGHGFPGLGVVEELDAVAEVGVCVLVLRFLGQSQIPRQQDEGHDDAPQSDGVVSKVHIIPACRICP